MKSVEVKFNEALAVLKAKTSPAKFTEVSEKYSKLPTIEAKLNCVEEAIAQAVKESDPLGLTNIDEVMSDPEVAILFGRDPQTKATIKEVASVVKKHNGQGDNFVEGNPFNEGRSAADTAANSTVNKARAESDAVLIDSLTYPKGHPKHGERLTEADKHNLKNGKPAAYANLTEAKKKEYDFARLIGLNESDALRVATL